MTAIVDYNQGQDILGSSWSTGWVSFWWAGDQGYIVQPELHQDNFNKEKCKQILSGIGVGIFID